jgi:hypothetical protein
MAWPGQTCPGVAPTSGGAVVTFHGRADHADESRSKWRVTRLSSVLVLSHDRDQAYRFPVPQLSGLWQLRGRLSRSPMRLAARRGEASLWLAGEEPGSTTH